MQATPCTPVILPPLKQALSLLLEEVVTLTLRGSLVHKRVAVSVNALLLDEAAGDQAEDDAGSQATVTLYGVPGLAPWPPLPYLVPGEHQRA